MNDDTRKQPKQTKDTRITQCAWHQQRERLEINARAKERIQKKQEKETKRPKTIPNTYCLISNFLLHLVILLSPF